jgi:hypothetical protein
MLVRERVRRQASGTFCRVEKAGQPGAREQVDGVPVAQAIFEEVIPSRR